MLRITSLIILFLLVSFKSFSAEKIVYLDVDFLLSNSKIGKEILDNLQKINTKNNEILNSKEQNLQLEKKSILNQKNILTDKVYDEKVKNFQIKINEFNEEKNRLAQTYNKIKSDEINIFFKKVDKILGDYVTQNSIDLVLNKKDILMGKNNYNITNQIIEILNSQK